jgi:hypothetical protein
MRGTLPSVVRAPLSLVPLAAEIPPPWWAVRLQELSERELRLFAFATGGHVPSEVRFNLEQLERERFALLAEHVG